MSNTTTDVESRTPAAAKQWAADAAPLETNRRLAIWIAAGLAIVTFVVYFRTLHNGYISYDDYDYISNNLLVRQGLTWHGIAQAFTSFDQSNWFPLEWISLMATRQFFGLSPFAFHLTNLVLHVANVVLLFGLLRAATRRTARAATVAALFAVFPMNVEAVAWATERKSVLSVFFMLLALWGYGRYAKKPNLANYFMIVLPFALGLMTKAWLVTFPFALLLLDYWPLGRFGHDAAREPDATSAFAQLVVEKIPLFLMSFAVTLIGVHAAHSGDALAISAAHAPFSLRLENALCSYLAYVLKGIWPARLAIIYPFPQQAIAVWKIVCAAAFLAGTTALLLKLRAQRYLIVGWLWYLGALFPLIGLIQTGTQSMADRWAYISFIGLFIAAVGGLADLAVAMHVPKAALACLAGAVIVAYSFVSYVQTGYWFNGFTLYTHALQVTNGNGSVRVNLGVEYEHAGRPDLALQEYRQATIDTPNLGIAHYDLAHLLNDGNDPLEAISEYELAIANTGVPHEIADAHIGLGAIYSNMNLPDKALQQFSAALAANPSDVYALIDRGMIEYKQGDIEGARKDFSRSAEITPTPGTWLMLGTILEQEKNVPAAIQAYQTALQMNPNLLQAREHLEALRQQTAQ
jgi:protein O-mannosyl-transferase